MEVVALKKDSPPHRIRKHFNFKFCSKDLFSTMEINSILKMEVR